MNCQIKSYSLIILLKKYFFIYLLILYLFLVSFFIKRIKSINKQFKVCLCTPAKKENLYIREFVEHYKNYGVDNIFLYDNNELNGERFEDVINDYIKNGFVKIINYRGYKKIALQMMNDCYEKNYFNYDWLIFFEVDEYVYLKNYNNIKNYLKNKRFQNCERIQLNWVLHTDNNLLYYDNRSIVERFPEKEQIKNNGRKNAIKSILKGHIINIKIKDIHLLNKQLRACDGFGNYIKKISHLTDKSDFEYYYINHYFCKSTEEFINKINKGDVLYFKSNILLRINFYYKINKKTIEKINLMENRTGLNLSSLKKNLKN